MAIEQNNSELVNITEFTGQIAFKVNSVLKSNSKSNSKTPSLKVLSKRTLDGALARRSYSKSIVCLGEVILIIYLRENYKSQYGTMISQVPGINQLPDEHAKFDQLEDLSQERLDDLLTKNKYRKYTRRFLEKIVVCYLLKNNKYRYIINFDQLSDDDKIDERNVIGQPKIIPMSLPSNSTTSQGCYICYNLKPNNPNPNPSCIGSHLNRKDIAESNTPSELITETQNLGNTNDFTFQIWPDTFLMPPYRTLPVEQQSNPMLFNGLQSNPMLCNESQPNPMLFDESEPTPMLCNESQPNPMSFDKSQQHSTSLDDPNYFDLIKENGDLLTVNNEATTGEALPQNVLSLESSIWNNTSSSNSQTSVDYWPLLDDVSMENNKQAQDGQLMQNKYEFVEWQTV